MLVAGGGQTLSDAGLNSSAHDSDQLHIRKRKGVVRSTSEGSSNSEDEPRLMDAGDPVSSSIDDHRPTLTKDDDDDAIIGWKTLPTRPLRRP